MVGWKDAELVIVRSLLHVKLSKVQVVSGDQSCKVNMIVALLERSAHLETPPVVAGTRRR